jgi:acetoacetate decarboxylase
MNLPADIAVTSENLEFYQKLAAPDFILEQVIFVTNQYGDDKVAIYGLGKMKGLKYEAD